MWAYGAFVEGQAYAFDYQNGEVAEVFDAVAGDGKITVRLVSGSSLFPMETAESG